MLTRRQAALVAKLAEKEAARLKRVKLLKGEAVSARAMTISDFNLAADELTAYAYGLGHYPLSSRNV